MKFPCVGVTGRVSRRDMYSRVHSFYEAHTDNKNYAQLAACSDVCNFWLRKIHTSPSLISTRMPVDLLAIKEVLMPVFIVRPYT